MTPKYTAIIDQIGRTIIGQVLSDTDTTLVIRNPVILHCQPEANGQLQVQSFPVFFFEFIDKAFREENDWTYYKQNVVTSNVTLDSRIIDQYNKINTPADIVSTKGPKVISINDV